MPEFRIKSRMSAAQIAMVPARLDIVAGSRDDN